MKFYNVHIYDRLTHMYVATIEIKAFCKLQARLKARAICGVTYIVEIF